MAQYLSRILVQLCGIEAGSVAHTRRIDLRPFRPASFAHETQAVGLG